MGLSRFTPGKQERQSLELHHLRPEQVDPARLDRIRRGLAADPDPEISVVIIAYNEEPYLLATLETLSRQLRRKPTEFILVDNNSTDRTAEIARMAGLEPVSEQRQGYAFARQAGLEKARGKYVVTGDTDTLYRPHWASQLAAALERPGVTCSYGMHAFYSDEGRYPLSLYLYQYAKLAANYLKGIGRPHLNCGGASMAYPRELALELGGYNLELKRGSDGYIAYQLSQRGRVVRVAGRKAMIFTNMRRTLKDGNLWQAFAHRFRHQMRYFFHYFTKHKE